MLLSKELKLCTDLEGLMIITIIIVFFVSELKTYLVCEFDLLSVGRYLLEYSNYHFIFH